MDVRILGPVEISGETGPVRIDAPKERAVVAVLALTPGKPVLATTIIDALWGEDPPATAAKTLQTYVSRLRKTLGVHTIRSDSAGYALCISPHAVDATRFERLVADGAEATRRGDFRGGVAALTEALDLWRARPLTELADSDLARGQLARLEELRDLALERRFEAELGLGHHTGLVAELEAQVTRQPLREPLWGLLMVALYRSERRAEALRCYQRLRRVLRDELGVEPSPPLTRLESRILRQDPSLDLDPPPPPHNLPASLRSFIGREADTAAVEHLVADHRLVTLVGPGGVGKTRLALEAARSLLATHTDGVWWIDLAAIRDPQAIEPRIAATLGITPAPTLAVLDAIVRFARARQLLLVLDNCEHVVERVRAVVGEIVASAPEVDVLATSRLPLEIAGESRYAVAPLTLPDADTPSDALGTVDAVRLFVERAEQLSATPLSVDELRTVADICVRLDGVPLAIELAAARSAWLGPQEIRRRLDRHLDVLSVASPDDPRHGSLHAVFDWSYTLLDPKEQWLFDRLCVFPGTFDLAAAEAVTGAHPDDLDVVTVLGRLVETSMVAVVLERSAERRFRILEVMREYGRAHLTELEREATHRRHTEHFRHVARAAAAAMETPAEAEACATIDREDHNIRAAVNWSLDHEPRSATLEFVPAVAYAWYVLGSFREAVNLCEIALAGSGDAEPRLRAWALYRLVWPAFLRGDAERAFEANAHARDLARSVGAVNLEALTLMSEGHMRMLGLGDIDGAMPWYEQSLATCDEVGLVWEKTWPLVGAAQALVTGDRPDGVAAMLDEAERIALGHGDDYRLAHLYMVRFLLAWCLDDIPGVITAATEMSGRSRRAGNTMYEQMSMVGLGVGQLFAGRLDEAEARLFSAARLALDDGNAVQLGVALQGLAALAAAVGDPDRAARLLGASTTLVPFWPLMRRRYERYLAPARDELGDRFDSEVEVGRALAPEAAVVLALETSAPPA